MTLVQFHRAPAERTDKVIDTMTGYFLNKKKKCRVNLYSCWFLIHRVGQNAGLAFIKLKDWSERISPESQIGAIIQRGMALNMIQERCVLHHAFTITSNA